MSLSTPSRAVARTTLVKAHWGAIGNSITAGWGTTDPGTKAYPVVAGVPGIGRPGQTLTHPNDWNPKPCTGTFAGDINTLKAKGVNAIVVEIGINEVDYDEADSVWQNAYTKLFTAADNHHVHMALATITPFGAGTTRTAAALARRQTMNRWIRANTRYVDYAKKLGGTVLLPEYDCGDHTHPSDAGAAAIAAVLTAYMAAHVKIRKP